ncbi:MAG: hypothetical protein COA58_06765 [Bacteroidetes bacterium]|nr:MAG: hypothetical protein COA58_06765 [Bacteroidota bacterium]
MRFLYFFFFFIILFSAQAQTEIQSQLLGTWNLTGIESSRYNNKSVDELNTELIKDTLIQITISEHTIFINKFLSGHSRLNDTTTFSYEIKDEKGQYFTLELQQTNKKSKRRDRHTYRTLYVQKLNINTLIFDLGTIDHNSPFIKYLDTRYHFKKELPQKTDDLLNQLSKSWFYHTTPTSYKNLYDADTLILSLDSFIFRSTIDSNRCLQPTQRINEYYVLRLNSKKFTFDFEIEMDTLDYITEPCVRTGMPIFETYTYSYFSKHITKWDLNIGSSTLILYPSKNKDGLRFTYSIDGNVLLLVKQQN